jgi:hypothetical protein
VHATYADVDGDGIPDFIVDKRSRPHSAYYLNPAPSVRPSGAGSTLLAVDLNKRRRRGYRDRKQAGHLYLLA